MKKAQCPIFSSLFPPDFYALKMDWSKSKKNLKVRGIEKGNVTNECIKREFLCPTSPQMFFCFPKSTQVMVLFPQAISSIKTHVICCPVWQHQSGPVLEQVLLRAVQGSPPPPPSPHVHTENSEKVKDEGDWKTSNGIGCIYGS